LIRLLDRLLLFLYSIAVAVVSVAAIAAAGGGIADNDLNQAVSQLTGGSRSVQGAVIGAAVFLLLVSLRFLIVSVKRSGSSAPSINQRTEHGDIRISVETVENLALKAASRTRGIKDLRARVRVAESGLEILIRAFVDGDGSIPALSEEMQRSVSSHIEELTGIPVAEVSVYIANVTQAPSAYKSRVE
jgi:uncharacterized alkaline shock family protein YloU